MAIKITMPPGGQTTDESMIAKWHKAVGDSVKKGEVLFEIETDKATIEIESFADGVLLEIKYQEGESVSTGEVVAYIGDKDEKVPEDSKPSQAQEDSLQENRIEEKIGKADPIKENRAGEDIIKKDIVKNEEEDEYQPIIKTKNGAELTAGSTSKILASPAAKFLAKQYHLNLAELGKKFPGQILKRKDVENCIDENRNASTNSSTTVGKSISTNTGISVSTNANMENAKPLMEEEYDSIITTPMRKTIARRMMESVSVAPCYNISIEIDMTRAIALHQEFNDHIKERGFKISFNDIMMKCASKAIEKNRMINSSYGEDEIKVYHDVNFGLAVGLENGLVVPVVRHTNRKPITDIAKENSENIAKARSGKLQAAQMSGGTITLSSLGSFGIDSFTAIINQPESCILAVGSIIDKPVVQNGEIVSKPMMNITATFDHRVIDGAAGAAFLRDVKALLEKPNLLLM